MGSAIKKSFIPRTVYFALLLATLLSESSAFSAQSFDHSLWGRFLDRYVTADGRVDYEAVAADPDLLNQYLRQIEEVKLLDLRARPREEQLAFWLNVFHAGIIKVIIDHWPVESIQDIPGAWDLPVVKLGEAVRSLNRIRSGELIGKFRDEKIHTAMACGAVSCPRLIGKPYTSLRVEGQLYLAARRFVNDPEYNKIIPEDSTVKISKIFKWHAQDFTLDFGSFDDDTPFSKEESAVLSFLAYYLDDPLKARFLEGLDYKIKYLPFDWSLNHVEGARAQEMPTDQDAA